MSKKYLDEIILEERKKRLEQALDEDVDLEEDLPEGYLQTIVLGGAGVSIKIPAFLEDMPEKWIEVKYQYDPVPQIIKTNSSGTVNFTFSVLDISIPGQDLPLHFQGAMDGMHKVFPELMFFGKGEEKIHGIQVCWAEYMNNARGGKLYNLLFFAAAEKIVTASLNCPYDDHELWVRIGKLCMKTIREGEANEPEGEHI